MLYKLAQDYKATGVFTPKKYFSIDRVFRNEALDKTHLAEFHQCEGLVCDRGPLTFLSFLHNDGGLMCVYDCAFFLCVGAERLWLLRESSVLTQSGWV